MNDEPNYAFWELWVSRDQGFNWMSPDGYLINEKDIHNWFAKDIVPLGSQEFQKDLEQSLQEVRDKLV